jgi:hypothetical protein
MQIHSYRSLPVFLLATAAAFLLAAATPAAAAGDNTAEYKAAISIAGQSYGTWSEYFNSQYFTDNGKRCGKPATTIQQRVVDPSDCTASFTNPSSDYIPGTAYKIPVVVHIIENSSGDGAISDALVNSQIDVMNEDFLALAGTPGAPGYDTAIQFVLASTDPSGSPTTGITRDTNDTWFNDNGSYWNTLAWDTNNYLNIYTNLASGNLGYVPGLPQSGIVGTAKDRIVILWSAFGRNAPAGPPYDQGRTATHELGHYFGLEHTFRGGCAAASSPACYSTGDLICDTNSEHNSTDGCPGGKTTCGTPDPIDNYMDYSDDTCMEMFTMEQGLRIRCSLLNYRPDLWDFAIPPVCGNNMTESGEDCDGSDDSACSTLCQIDCMCPAPVCGNNIVETGEDCDGINDSACPGLCDGSCACPITCNIGDLNVIKGKSDEKKFVWKAELDNSSGTYMGADPRNEFIYEVVQGANSVTVNIPALDIGWVKSKPLKGKWLWKGLLNGIKKVKLVDKTLKKNIWKVLVVGKEVPGAELIDVISGFADIEMTMDGICGGGSY